MPINIDGSKGIRQNTTEVTKIPVGTTAQRPANPEAGMIRFNTDQGFVEWYDDVGDRWLATSSFPGVVATGGAVTDIEQDGQLFRVHTFTSDGTFEITRGGDVDYFIVGGGGGAGFGSGNAGAGGFTKTGSIPLSEGSYSAIVGSGGVSIGIGEADDGEPSSIFGEVAQGGGGANTDKFGDAGADGGSGGGGRDSVGGDGGSDGSDGQAGGAGGGGSGQGTTTRAFGEATGQLFAGGGGGGARAGTPGSGGAGGGGDGSGNFAAGPGQDGVTNTGGGGGGGGRDSGGSNRSPGGTGGSGIVIVRYKIG